MRWSRLLSIGGVLGGIIAFIATVGPSLFDRFGVFLFPDAFISMENRVATDVGTLFHRRHPMFEVPMVESGFHSLLLMYNQSTRPVTVYDLTISITATDLEPLQYDDFDYFSVYEGGMQNDYNSLYIRVSCRELSLKPNVVIPVVNVNNLPKRFDISPNTTAILSVYVDGNSDCDATDSFKGAAKISYDAKFVGAGFSSSLDADSPLSIEFGLSTPPKDTRWRDLVAESSPIPELARWSGVWLGRSIYELELCLKEGKAECEIHEDDIQSRYPNLTSKQQFYPTDR